LKPVFRLAAPLLAGCAALPAAAVTAPAAVDALATVTVTATRIAADAFDVPASIASVPAAQLQDQALGINLSDDIATVPGLLARNRNNYAQDQQISIRGIGANSTFGIRGVRIY
jgi:iron complex outermembrane recepter protein